MATSWGIITTGRIAHDFVCCLRNMPDKHKIVAVSASNLEKAEAFAHSHNIPKAYGSYEELATDKDVEVAHVGVINPYHLPVGKLLLKAEKHVLMEQPMAMNLKQTKRLIETAKSNNRFLMEGLWSRFFPSYSKLLEELKRNRIGDVYSVHVTFGLNLEKEERIMKKELGGGTILEIGTYILSAVTMIYGGMKPKKIAAVGHLNDDGIDENVSVSLLYDDKKVATIATSALGDLPCELVVYGTKGTLKLPFPFWSATTLVTPKAKHNFPLPEAKDPTLFNYINSAGLQYEAEEVRRCLQEGLLESPRMPHSDSLLLAEITDEIRKQLGVVYRCD